MAGPWRETGSVVTLFCVHFKVVDLLVSMCRSALESPRKVVIFEPYPSVVDPNDPQMLAFNPRVRSRLATACLHPAHPTASSNHS